MTKDEALKIALQALKTIDEAMPFPVAKLAQSAIKEALAQPEPMRLRRGDILRCIETDELCTVWSTSTTGKTLIKWGDNDFGGYTAEQIGELFWLEPSPDDLELAAEKSDNYAAFHAGYRFAVAHPLAQPEHEPVAWKLVPIKPTDEMLKAMDECSTEGYDERLYAGHAASVYMAAVDVAPTPPQRKPLTDEEIYDMYNEPRSDAEMIAFARAIEAAHGIKGLV
jgi:hypothetical protein